MKKAKNELLQLLAGLLMLVAGLFILSQKVMVSSGFFGYGFMLGGIYLGNGLIMVPFIIGILWMFGSGGSFLSKLFTVASVVIIIVAIIMTTNLSMVRISLYEWVLILVLIFGGAGLVARLLFSDRKDAARNADVEKTEEQRRIDAIEEELKRIRKDM